MYSGHPEAKAKSLEAEAKPNLERLRIEEIEWIVSRIRLNVQVIQEDERRIAEEKARLQADEDREGRVFKPRITKLKDPQNWSTHFSLQSHARDNFHDSHGKWRELKAQAVHTIAQELQGESTIYSDQRRPNKNEYLYDKELARRVRIAVLEILEKGEPAEDERNWRDKNVRPKSSTVFAIEPIVEFLKVNGIGTFERYIDEKGQLNEYCSDETMDSIRTIYNQLKVQEGYKDPAYLLEALAKRNGGKTELTLDEIMAELKKTGANKPNNFRPAIGRRCYPITSVNEDLYERVRDGYLDHEAPKADWLTTAEIKKRHRLKITSTTLRSMSKKLCGENESDQMEIRTSKGGHRTKYYSPKLTAKMAAEAIRKGFTRK